jgi:hypothetical protein
MRRSRWSSSVFVLLLATPLVARAVDREFVLKWLPPSGTVNGYRVYLGTAGQPMQALDLGAVASDPDGIAREALQLDAAKTYTVEMTAYNQVGESARSNQIAVPASTCDPAACSDGDPCTADDCQNLSCTHTRLPDGSVCGSGSICLSGACRVPQCTSDAGCADADRCNGSERCSAFRCTSGTPLACPAPGPCQQGGCDAGSGCFTQNLPDGSRCDDGDPATSGDQCRSGRCAGSAPTGCSSDADCSDGNACNGRETCGAGGACSPGTALVCGNATACADPICTPASGCGLAPKPDGTACDDGQALTAGDRCSAGQCRGTPVATPAAPDALSLVSITPSSVRRWGFYHVILAGTGFAPGMKVAFRSTTANRKPWVTRVKVLGPEKTDVLIWVSPRRASALWDVAVMLSDGRTAVLPAAFRTDP